MKSFFKNQLNFLLFGFIFWLPVVIAIFIFGFLYGYLEDAGKRLLFFLPDRFLHSGFGFIFGILIIYLSGLILRFTRISDFLSRIPVIGIFFGKGKMITPEKLRELTPCIFLISHSCISYGWILGQVKTEIDDKYASCLIEVYYPNVPILITGQTFLERKECVIKLGNSFKEIVDLLLYGLKTPEGLKLLPWEDETLEMLEQRVKNFGLNASTSP